MILHMLLIWSVVGVWSNLFFSDYLLVPCVIPRGYSSLALARMMDQIYQENLLMVIC